MTDHVAPTAAERWERRSEWPLILTAVLFLVAYAWPILDPELPPLLLELCTTASWVTWGLFALDYVVRLVLAEQRQAFVKGNLVDLAAVVLPMLRPLRLLRLVTLLSVLNRTAAIAFRGRLAVYVAGATSLLVGVAGLAILDAEREHPDANITTYGDALWWAVTTMTTVGYGDRYPVTTTGRLVAFGLMIAGVALLGVVTGTLASYIVQRINATEQVEQGVTRAQIQSLTAQIAALRAEVTVRTAPATDAYGDDQPHATP